MKNTSRPQLDPAARIIRLCGGVDAVASATGVHITRVYGWRVPRDTKQRTGTGGSIPQKYWGKLINLAGENGELITVDDFLAEPSEAMEEEDAQ
jgi:hypothetical protein